MNILKQGLIFANYRPLKHTDMKHLSTFFLLIILFLFTSHTGFSQITRWRSLTDFPGGGRTGAFSFSIGDKIYIGGGSSGGTILSDFWEYNISTGVWTRR